MAVLPDREHREAARAMLETLRLRPAELERHLECALSPDYWRALVPSLSVGREVSIAEGAPLLGIARDDVLNRFEHEGLIHAPSMAGDDLTSRMRSAVSTIARADWPPVFSWVYDEFWRVPRAAPLVDLLSAILGDGYRQTPHIWTHLVPGRRGAPGWRPHTDYEGPDRRLTMWIALSDATVETGCICVIPKHRVPERVHGKWYELASIEKSDVMDILHGSRPLPVSAGTVLIWDADLMHWGSPRQAAGDPRISCVLEFAPATTTTTFIGPSLPGAGAELPSHQARLAMIAQALEVYRGSEPRNVRYADLSVRLLHRLGAA